MSCTGSQAYIHLAREILKRQKAAADAVIAEGATA
jgi:hypothetical protein